MAKMIWRIIINKSSILHNCLKAKYITNTLINEVRIKPKDSFLWKTLFHTKDTLLKGCCWKGGMEKRLRFEKIHGYSIKFVLKS